jgi:site-specific DNA-methyltransferase (adenine-specific)
LKKSISEFPEMMEKRPIVCVTDADGKLYPLGGNMRLKALQELGYKEISDNWILLADEWTEEQRREFVIKDNVGFGEWNWEELANEWDAEKLEEWGLDLPDFGTDEILEAEEDDFDVDAETIKTDIVLGDLFEIGEHRLLCGDSTCSDTVAKLMNGEKADLGLTDPPYNLGYDYATYDDNLTSEEYNDFIIGYVSNLISFSEKQIITSGKQNVGYYYKNFDITEFAVWYAKNKMSGSKIANLGLCEPILFIGKFNRNARATDMFEFTVKQQKETGGHTCPKVMEFFSDLLNSYSDRLILDLFLGSGTTMVAAHQLKRKCYGMELDPKYCDVIVRRMLTYDKALKIKRNGVDETDKWLQKINE